MKPVLVRREHYESSVIVLVAKSSRILPPSLLSSSDVEDNLASFRPRPSVRRRFVAPVTLPNYITLSRILSIPLLIWILSSNRFSSAHGEKELVASALFILPMGAAEAIAGENPDQQWDAKNAAERYVIGQIHRGRKIAPGQKAGNETMLNYPPRRMTKAMTAAESCWILQPGR